MYKLFNNILIPLNSSPETERTVEKGIALANIFSCNIHLLLTNPFRTQETAIKKIFSFNSQVQKNTTQKQKLQLEALTENFQPYLNNGLKIFTSIEIGNRNDVAINHTIRYKIDLVMETVLSSNMQRNKLGLDVNHIAGKTSAAVITVPEDCRFTNLYSMVIPVTDFIPLRKLMYGIYLSRYYKATIHLLGITRKSDFEYSQKVEKYLHRSYQLIRDNCNVPIDLTVRDGSNIAEVVKEYAASNNTDLVIVNAGRQSRLKSYMFGWFTGILQKNIYPPVLTIGTP